MGHRIAVVDDEEGIRCILAQLLETRGWTVEPYDSVESALRGLATNPPDLLIVDVHLPDGCGLDLIGRVRTQSGKTVPAIVLSGSCEEQDIVRGFAAGAIDFISKPFHREELIGRCAVQLGRTATPSASSSALHPVARLSEPLLPRAAGDLVFGRYELVSELGRGGQGCVLLVRDTAQAGERLALKVLSPSATRDETTRTRFIRETYALAKVRHPGVVVIRDVGAFQGWLYYTMEHVVGPSLRKRVAQEPLGHDDVRLLAHGLLRALAALDESRLIHRDLKPENIILRDGDPARPVIIDFGLARGATDRAITRPDTIIGTPGYVAPEVVRGQDPDHRSDLFCLGLTLRHALTGQDVFPHLSGLRLLEAVARGPIPIPRCAPDLEELLRGLLQIDPRRRFATAADVLTAHPQLDGQVGHDEPTRRVQRPQRISSESVAGLTWLDLQAELGRRGASTSELEGGIQPALDREAS